jgi:hypothetical protein
VSADVLAKLRAVADGCASYDFRAAQKAQTELANMEWAKTKDWQKGVRHIVTLALIKSQVK